MEVVNEIAAFLGFLIPSSVLWVVWGIRAASEKQRDAIERTEKTTIALQDKLEQLEHRWDLQQKDEEHRWERLFK